MKAREVLERYAAGERDFRRVNLRGQSFKGQNLAGADFSEADVRSTNFTGANLRGTKFCGAKCGLKKQFVTVLQIISSLMLIVSEMCSLVTGLAGFIVIYGWTEPNQAPSFEMRLIGILVSLVYLTIILFLVNQKGVYKGFFWLGGIVFLLTILLILRKSYFSS